MPLNSEAVEGLIRFWENKLKVVQLFGDITSENFIQLTIASLKKLVIFMKEGE